MIIDVIKFDFKDFFQDAFVFSCLEIEIFDLFSKFIRSTISKQTTETRNTISVKEINLIIILSSVDILFLLIPVFQALNDMN